MGVADKPAGAATGAAAGASSPVATTVASTTSTAATSTRVIPRVQRTPAAFTAVTASTVRTATCWAYRGARYTPSEPAAAAAEHTLPATNATPASRPGQRPSRAVAYT